MGERASGGTGPMRCFGPPLPVKKDVSAPFSPRDARDVARLEKRVTELEEFNKTAMGRLEALEERLSRLDGKKK